MEWIKDSSINWETFVNKYSSVIYSLVKNTCEKEKNGINIDDTVCNIFERFIENNYQLLKNFKGECEGSFLLYLKDIVTTKTKEYLKENKLR